MTGRHGKVKILDKIFCGLTAVLPCRLSSSAYEATCDEIGMQCDLFVSKPSGMRCAGVTETCMRSVGCVALKGKKVTNDGIRAIAQADT